MANAGPGIDLHFVGNGLHMPASLGEQVVEFGQEHDTAVGGFFLVQLVAKLTSSMNPLWHPPLPWYATADPSHVVSPNHIPMYGLSKPSTAAVAPLTTVNFPYMYGAPKVVFTFWQSPLISKDSDCVGVPVQPPLAYTPWTQVSELQEISCLIFCFPSELFRL